MKPFEQDSKIKIDPLYLISFTNTLSTCSNSSESTKKNFYKTPKKKQKCFTIKRKQKFVFRRKRKKRKDHQIKTIELEKQLYKPFSKKKTAIDSKKGGNRQILKSLAKKSDLLPLKKHDQIMKKESQEVDAEPKKIKKKKKIFLLRSSISWKLKCRLCRGNDEKSKRKRRHVERQVPAPIILKQILDFLDISDIRRLKFVSLYFNRMCQVKEQENNPNYAHIISKNSFV